ncbi:hypothetical protein Q7C36_018739 [Tachysurus vachellii]|uniref:FZ domain-containing protein n=1 Tax=Tachysurus vachellii TaxID=175792 RepID=A0AA88LWQ8_TACVA|nr:hypothetical protein Q7C36_018739 [Tachysurus vachellii]
MSSTEKLRALSLEEQREPPGVSGVDVQVMGDTCSHKLGSTKLLKLLIIILPCVCGLICLLTLLLAFTGIIGNGLLDSSDSAPLSATDVSMATLVSNVAVTMDDNLDDVNTTTAISSETFHPQSPSTETLISDSSSFSSSSFPLDATPTPTADWLMSFSTLNDLSSVEPTRTNSDPGACYDITEAQCHMLPYNQSGMLPGAMVVKHGEMEIFLRFFTYLNRLNCYSHIMLFGCTIALPQCVTDGGNMRVILPCQSFCEAAKRDVNLSSDV